MTTTNKLTQEVIDRLVANTEPWLSCDDCFEQADLAIEALLDSRTQFSDPFRVHLLACGVCHEEAESLAALVAEDHEMSGSQAIDLLDRELARAAD